MGTAASKRPPTRDGRGRAPRPAPPSRRADARATSGFASTRPATSSCASATTSSRSTGSTRRCSSGWHVDSNLSRRLLLHRGSIESLDEQSPATTATTIARPPSTTDPTPSATTSLASSWRSSAPTSPTSAASGGWPTSSSRRSRWASGESPLHRRAPCRDPRCAAWQIPVEPVRDGVRAHLRLRPRAAAHRGLDRGLGSAPHDRLSRGQHGAPHPDRRCRSRALARRPARGALRLRRARGGRARGVRRPVDRRLRPRRDARVHGRARPGREARGRPFVPQAATAGGDRVRTTPRTRARPSRPGTASPALPARQQQHCLPGHVRRLEPRLQQQGHALAGATRDREARPDRKCRPRPRCALGRSTQRPARATRASHRTDIERRAARGLQRIRFGMVAARPQRDLESRAARRAHPGSRPRSRLDEARARADVRPGRRPAGAAGADRSRRRRHARRNTRADGRYTPDEMARPAPSARARETGL